MIGSQWLGKAIADIFLKADTMRRHSTYEKVMSSILGLVVLLILGFLLRAVASPSVSFQTSINFKSDASTVWPYLVEEGKRTKWQTGVRTVVSLMGGEMVMGSRSIVIKRVGAKQWEIEEEIVDYTKYEAFAVIHSSQDYVENIAITLVEKEGYVELVYSSNKIHNAFGGRLTAPWTSHKERGAVEVSLQTLKAQVEDSTG